MSVIDFYEKYLDHCRQFDKLKKNYSINDKMDVVIWMKPKRDFLRRTLEQMSAFENVDLSDSDRL